VTEKSIVASTFGICCGLLKDDYPADGFICSLAFERVVSQINAMMLDDRTICNFGTQIQVEVGMLRDEISQYRKIIEEFEENTKTNQSRIQELESSLDNFRKSQGTPLDLDVSGIARDITTLGPDHP